MAGRRKGDSISYRFAIDDNQTLIDIQAAPDIPLTGTKCLACGRTMIARRGARRAHHFAHKSEGDCNPESYRHRLAKRLFAQTYRRCLERGRPYTLVHTVSERCNFYEDQYGFSCDRTRKRRDPLTRWLDVVEVEGAIGEFRADVLLRSIDSRRAILVEFVVTHEPGEKKIASGHPIIEIPIPDEAAAIAMRREQLDVFATQAKLHNFARWDDPQPRCRGQCERPVTVFMVHRSGKCVLADIPARQVQPRLRRYRPLDWRQLREERRDPRRLFRDEVARAHASGVEVRNCFVCVHHRKDGHRAAVYCTRYRGPNESNQAADCPGFDPIPREP